MWKSIHMNPEEAVNAAIELMSNQLFPIHWGTFDLAIHGWSEPVEHLIIAAEKKNLNIVIPKPGEIVRTNLKTDIRKWWINTEIKSGVVYE